MEAYLDNSATTCVYQETADLVCDLMVNHYGNPSAMHQKGVEAEQYIRTAQETLAKILKVKEKEIFFTSGGTESDNWAISAAVWQGRHVGRHIITTALEHSAILEPCKWLAQQGYEITYLKPDRTGHVTAQQVADALREDTVLVSMMLVNNETGCVFPVGRSRSC